MPGAHHEILMERDAVQAQFWAAFEAWGNGGPLEINIADLEIAHSSEGDRGVVIVLVDRAVAGIYQQSLVERGYRPSVRALD